MLRVKYCLKFTAHTF
jgi:hypothetical protein